MLSTLLASAVLAGTIESGSTELTLEQPPTEEERRAWGEARGGDYGPMIGDWELTLSGAGTSDDRFRNHNYAFNGSIGYFLTDQFEIAFRQGVNFSELGSDSVLRASSRAAIDLHFDFDRLQPFIGANIGYIYGDGRDTWVAGPEVGVKYFVTHQAFLFAQMEYLIHFRNVRDVDERARDGEFAFALGIGVIW